MKVLVFTQMYPSVLDPHFGTFVFDEVHALRELIDEVEVLYFNTKESRSNYFRIFPHFLKIVREFKPDIIHCHHTFCVFMAWVARCHNIVVTFHEGEYLSDKQNLRNQRRGDPIKILVHQKWLKRFFLRRAVHIFDVTGALNDWPNVTSPFIPGVNPDKFYPIEQSEARRRLGWSSEEKVILFPGRISNPVKRFDIAEAIQQAVAKQVSFSVRLVPLENLPHDQVKNYICASDVMLLVSDHEASPMVLKEALACGLPCVAFDVGDARKVLAADPRSFIVDSDLSETTAAVKMLLLSSPQERKNRLSEEFTVSHGAKTIYSVYRYLLSR